MPADLAYQGDLGEFFADHAENSTHNAYVDRPAMLELAGDVHGQQILDAGCGAGHHMAALIARGATVIGLEGSEALVALARTRLGEAAEVHQHELDTPLDLIEDASFDGVVCALVMHHLRDRPAFLHEVFRVLRPGGWFTLSTTHPTSDWLHFRDNYFSEAWVDLHLPGGQSIRYQRMSIETLVNEVIAAGFRLERLIEPRPAGALRELNSERYDQLNAKPSLMALKLRRP